LQPEKALSTANGWCTEKIHYPEKEIDNPSHKEDGKASGLACEDGIQSM